MPQISTSGSFLSAREVEEWGASKGCLRGDAGVVQDAVSLCTSQVSDTMGLP